MNLRGKKYTRDSLRNKLNYLLEDAYAPTVIRQSLLLKVSYLEALGRDPVGWVCDNLSVHLPPKGHRESNPDLSLFWQGLCWEGIGNVSVTFRIWLPVPTSEFAVARNCQLIRNVPSVMCPCDAVYSSDDELVLRRIKAIRNIWYDSWQQNVFVLCNSRSCYYLALTCP